MSKTAKYQQVEDYIIKEIRKDHLKNGDQIMTEEQLCQQFGFSRMTVNKALNHLSDEGYIKRIPGRGSFVTAPRVNKPIRTGLSFTMDMKNIGLVAGAKLISYEVLHGSDAPIIAEKLNLAPDDLIHYFIRLRTGNGKPIAISYSYIAAKVLPAINVDCLNHSFYEFLDQQGLTDRRTSQWSLRATLPTQEQKNLLNLANAALLCSAHVTTHISEGVSIPFEYTETYYNGDVYTYTVMNDPI